MVEAGLDISPIDYASTGVFVSLFLFIILTLVDLLLLVVAIKRDLLNTNLILILIFMVVVVPAIYFLYFLIYPKMQANKKKASIDAVLVFAIRDLMIKVSAGVPIFNAMMDIANGDYGEVAAQFKLTVEEIESGASQEVALKHLSDRIPSPAFRRAIDILLNAVKSGSDLEGTLALINDMLIKQQQSDMKSYAAELTPMSMAYMLISVVLPSLGMSVFLILGSMSHLNIASIVYLLPVFLVIFQVFFMGMVKNRRPAIGV